MSMKLIIVESPTKARTLTRFLKGGYKVEATMGHIRDLPKAELGVDVENGFDPRYVIPRDKAKRVRELKQIAKTADSVILATDPDREGEAIAWHMAHVLDAKRSFTRIVFHEITKDAILEALDHAREIDQKLVDAQQARRVLDRLVGYKLSPLLWKKLSKSWLSAGRVQSVAVRLIVEREREIEAFTKSQYYTIDAEFTAKNGQIAAKLSAKDGQKYEVTDTIPLFDGQYSTTRTTIDSENAAKSIIADFTAPFTVSAVDTKEVKRNPNPPYTTSTLQQDAGRRLYFSSKKTMQIAQKLYEEGLITYHRTDSVTLSEKFVAEARSFITTSYGAEYLPEAKRMYKTKSKVAQEAHEAIRPTDIAVGADSLNGSGELNRDHHRLYDLIWKRAVASQMREAIFDSTTIKITSANAYLFERQGSVIKFDGFLRVTGRDSDETVIPKVSVGENVKLEKSQYEAHMTSPPPRYTEASLVKTLEEKDIGRPSTYAPIISTIQDRQYVEKLDKKLAPTELGKNVTDFLVQYFPEILGLPFTAHLEDELDSVANGEKEWKPVIAEFYAPFQKALDTSYDIAEKVKMPVVELDEACPDCKNRLVIRVGKFGKFIACSTFPACKYTRQYLEKIDIPCPKCASAIVVKKSRKGKTFYGCSNYPACNFAAWKKEDIK